MEGPSPGSGGDGTPASRSLAEGQARPRRGNRHSADRITLLVGDGEKVHIGGEGGQALATQSFVETFYNQHIQNTAMGPTSPPIVASPLVPGTDITDKTSGE